MSLRRRAILERRIRQWQHEAEQEEDKDNPSQSKIERLEQHIWRANQEIRDMEFGEREPKQTKQVPRPRQSTTDTYSKASVTQRVQDFVGKVQTWQEKREVGQIARLERQAKKARLESQIERSKYRRQRYQAGQSIGGGGSPLERVLQGMGMAAPSKPQPQAKKRSTPRRPRRRIVYEY